MNEIEKKAIEEIPADAVIQALKCCTSSEYNCHHCPFKGVGTISDSCISAMSRSALDLIYRKQSEGEWVSVEERLPESNDRCIVWSFDYIWRIRFASYNNGTKRWYVVCGGEIKDTQRDGVKVTHWLPIPEPPKGE